MTTALKRRAPTPIFYNLAHLDIGAIPIVLQDVKCSVDIAVLKQDTELVTRFLLSYKGSTATFNAYRRELERLCQWSWFLNATSICKLTRDHIEEFIRFTLKPPKAWIGVKNVAGFMKRDGERVPNPNWRPFVASDSKIDFESGISPDTAK